MGAIILANSKRSVTLPPDLEWLDEYSWFSISDDIQYTVAGTLVISTSKKQSGRFITLGGGDDYGWLTQEQINALRELAEDGEDMTLTLTDNRIFTVRFRYDPTPFSCQRLFPLYNVYNNVKINLIAV